MHKALAFKRTRNVARDRDLNSTLQNRAQAHCLWNVYYSVANVSNYEQV